MSLLVLLLSFSLRLHQLGAQPVWSDEVYSIAVAGHSVAEAAGWVYRDNHPALYWLLLYPVVHWLGDGELLVRLPSAFMGTLTVALVFAAGRQMLRSRQAGLLAALWLTVSPIHVAYSQEARMYAPLALFGTASTLLLHRAATRGRWVDWVFFGVAAAATAHTHNYGLLLVAAQDLWMLCLMAWKRDAGRIQGFLLSQVILVGLYAPMIPALLAQLQMHIGSTGVATAGDILDLLEAFGAGFVGFSTPGLTPNALMTRTALPAVAVTVGLILLGLLLGGRQSAPRRRGLSLAAACFVVPVLAVWGYSSLFHKPVWQLRGFQMALGCFALLVGTGLAHLQPRPLRWGALLGLAALAAINLHPHYFERQKSTVPEAVAALEGRLGREDVVFVAPDWMWSPFRYYYRGMADAIGGRVQGGRLRFVGVGTDYADLIEPRALDSDRGVRQPIVSPQAFEPEQYARVWTVGHGATPQNVIALFGEDVVIMHYDLSERDWRGLVYPTAYAAAPSGLPLAVQTPTLRWDNGLRLLGYAWESKPVVGQTARLQLFWSTVRPQRHAVSLETRLIDPSGEQALSQTEPVISVLHGVPMVAMGIVSDFPITAWPEGDVVVQEVAVEMPLNLPPLSYRVDLQVSDKERGTPVPIGGDARVTMGEISVVRPPDPYELRAVGVQRRTSILFAGRVRLFGYNLPQAAPRPGHYLPVWLNWTAERAPESDYEVRLRLLDGRGAVMAEGAGTLCTPAFPTSAWRRGDLVQGKLMLPLPSDMDGGRYPLAVQLINAETGEPVPGKQAGGLRSREWIVIGEAKVAPWPMVTEAPPMEYAVEARFGKAVRLLGYDLDGPLSAAQALDLTLYWQVEAPLDRSYLVFVHLTNQAGALVAQADGIPVNWLRPTTTWRTGEIVADSYSMTLPEVLPEGAYRLYVGFYEPGPDGQRLPVTSHGQPVPDGRLPLEPIHLPKER